MSTPMHESKEVTINGKRFELNPMGAMKSIFVNSRLTAIFGPMMIGQIHLTSQALMSIPEKDQNYLFQSLLHGVKYLPDGHEPMPLELRELKNIEAAFACDLEGLYDLGMEVLEYENFPFFKGLKEKLDNLWKMMAKLPTKETLSPEAAKALETPVAGSAMNETSGSKRPGKSGKKNPTILETSDPSVPNSGSSGLFGG